MCCEYKRIQLPIQNTLGRPCKKHTDRKFASGFSVNETSQISERYSVQMKAPMKQKRLVMFGQMYVPLDDLIPETLLAQSI